MSILKFLPSLLCFCKMHNIYRVFALVSEMPYTTSTSITVQAMNKASFSFTINNFPEAKRIKKVNQAIDSEIFSIMASQLSIAVYPSGVEDKAKDYLSVYLHNHSSHKVMVKYSLAVEDNVFSDIYSEIKMQRMVGLIKFIRISDIGQNLEVTGQVTLLREDLLDESVGGLSLATWEFMKKSEEENLQNLEQRLKENLNQLEQKIDLKFEDLKEDIKAPARAPECPICFEELRPPVKIIQCLKGHKLCEPCSIKPEIQGCPGGCKAGFMGRDYGMEAFLLEQFRIR